MKISNASKKVLASALSAAMVVAFAPTAAFGLQSSQTFTLGYDLNGGVDTATGQDVLNTSVKELKAEDVAVGVKYVEATGVNASNFDAKKHYIQNDEGDYVLAKSFTEAAAAMTAHEAAVKAAGDDATKTYKWDSVNKKYVAYEDTASADAASYVFYEKGGKMVEAEAVAEVKTPTYYTAESVTAAGTTLSSNGNLQLKSGSSFYKFLGYEVGFDANGDGDFDDEGDINVNDLNGDGVYAKGAGISLANEAIGKGATLTAKAIYDTPVINDEALVVDNAADKGYATLTLNVKGNYTGTPINGGKFVVTSPSGAATELSLEDANKAATVEGQKITVAAEAGTWTVAFVDGNGVTVDSYKEVVSAVKLTGAIFTDQFNASLKATSAIAYYVKGDTNADTYSEVLGTISAANIASATVDGKTISATNPAATFYTAKGTDVTTDAEVKNLPQKGEVTEIAASYGATVSNFVINDADKYQADLTVSGIQKADLVDPAGKDNGYYIAVTDESGKVVGESLDTDKAVPANELSFTNGSSCVTATLKNLAAGTYTATLYKVTGATDNGLTDGSAAVKTAISSKSVTVAGVAAPTWAYASNADVKKGGTLTLANAAGTGYKVQYKVGSGAFKDYDETKPGITVSTSDIAAGIEIKAVATATDKKDATYGTYSSTVKLWGYNASKQGVNVLKGFVAAGSTQTINEQVTVYYSANADVKAAVAAAEKTFSDAGFVAVTDGTADTEWNATIIAGEKSVLAAVAGVAKAEVAKYYAGIEGKDGSLTKISDDNNAKANAAVDAVLAAFDANHDADKTNNVQNGKVAYTDAAYYANIDKALVDAKKAAVTYKADDVKAAKAVTDALKGAKTTDELTAALKAYNDLSATQKELVAAADVAAAQAALNKAELAEAQDEAAIAKVKGKTVKAKAKKATKSSLKVVKSKSGAKSTFKKTSGNSKVKVYKSGKIVVKKGLKAGKKYTVKVKATVGTQTKTVKVIVKVAK